MFKGEVCRSKTTMSQCHGVTMSRCHTVTGGTTYYPIGGPVLRETGWLNNQMSVRGYIRSMGSPQ